MDVDYITAEIARLSADIACLNTVETILIWAMILTVGAIVIGLIFEFGADSGVGGGVAFIGVILFIILIIVYAGTWATDWGMSAQYDALLAAYEGMI